jgi:hypothetical protein
MRHLTILLLSALALLVAACGGGGDDGTDEARALLRATFTDAKPVTSGKVDLSLKIDGRSLPGVGQDLDLAVRGPFESQGDGKVPRFDLDLVLGTGQAGALQAGAISTGDRGWLKLMGSTYRLSQDTFGQLLKPSQSATQGGGLTLKKLGVEPESWLEDAEVVGTEDVAGAPTQHVRGTVDVPTLLDDLAALLSRAGSFGVQGAPPAAELSEEQRKQVAESVESAVVDVWTGEADKRLRRLLVEVRFKAEGDRKGTAKLDLKFADLDAPQPIEAPRDARPFSELQEGLAAIGAAVQAEQGQQQQGPGPEAGAQTPAAPEGDAYAQCLAQADGLAAQQRCAELLGG